MRDAEGEPVERWEPDPDQQARIDALASWLSRALPREFHFPEHIRERYEPIPSRKALGEPPLEGYLARTLDAMGAAHPAAFLERACPELFCFPATSPLRPPERDWSGPTWAFKMVGDLVAQAWFERHPSPYAVALLAGRARYILAHPFEGAELPQQALSDHPGRGCLAPTLRDTLAALVVLREHPAALEPIRQLVAGAWNLPVSLPGEWARRHVLKGRPTGYTLFGPDLTDACREFVELLHRRGLFDYADLQVLVRRVPHVAPGYLLERHYDDRSGFAAVLRDWTRRLVWEASASLAEENLELLDTYWSWKLYGARWLLRACEHVAATGLQPTAEQYGGPERAIRFLAEIHSLAPDDEPGQVVERLRGFEPAVLETVLPFSKAARPLVLRALRWEAAEPLYRLILSIGSGGSEQESDIGNSADPTSGVVDREQVVRCLAAAGPLAKRLIGRLRQAKVGPSNTLTLVEAVAGFNRAAILKSIDRDAQTPLKAYGLLPLERGDDELLERYLRLKQAHRDCRQYGLERQANTKAAVQAGLANLAQTAGFPDLARLEWAMEARVSEKQPRPGHRVPVQAWDVELRLSGLEARLVVTKAGKELASVPVAVRKSNAYEEMRESLEAWRDQTKRFRRAFEAMMVDGDLLGPGDLEALRRLPVARFLLPLLVLKDDQGFGMPDPELRSLRDENGGTRPLATPVRVAHVLDLFEADRLEPWQRTIVRARLVQPFRQVFRELYVMTPAERATATFSNRFAGHGLQPRVAARLFQSRDWQAASDETEVLPFKPLRRAGVVALFELTGARHFLGEQDDVVTTDRIRFVREGGAWRWRQEPDVPLSEVPARLFSEVMRDADLVVSVARSGEEALWSLEAVQRRAEVVQALVSELALPGVEIDGHFVRVKGRRASYRIHMGSAVVHIEPGSHLCIVPESSVRRPDLFLPFADEDARSAEVISKVLLLANDHQITDEQILGQIRTASRSAS